MLPRDLPQSINSACSFSSAEACGRRNAGDSCAAAALHCRVCAHSSALVQVTAETQAAAAALPISPAAFALALLLQRCADKHSAVSARAMAALSKALAAVLAAAQQSGAATQWLQPLVEALCHADSLVLEAERVAAAAGPLDAPPAAEDDGDEAGPSKCGPILVTYSRVFLIKFLCCERVRSHPCRRRHSGLAAAAALQEHRWHLANCSGPVLRIPQCRQRLANECPRTPTHLIVP